MKACVIASTKTKAAYAYAEALAVAQGFDFYPIDRAMHLSLSRYDWFFVADDPDAFGTRYLCKQFPGRVFGLVASVDRKLLIRSMTAAKEGRFAGIITAVKSDVDTLRSVVGNSAWAPVSFNVPSSEVCVYGLPVDDPGWLKLIQAFLKNRQQFTILPPVTKDVVDTLSQFPVNYSVCMPDDIDKAIMCSRVVFYDPARETERPVSKAVSFGKTVVPISKLKSEENPADYLDSLLYDKAHEPNRNDFARHNIENMVGRGNAPERPASNFLQLGGGVRRMHRLLVKFPTRSRPEKFLDVFEKKYCRQLSRRNEVHFLVVYDDDDETMTEEILQRVAACEAYGCEITIVGGSSRNKIDAFNRGINDVTEPWDVMMLAQDDVIPQFAGWDDAILMAMEKYFPDTDGSLWFHDGGVGKRLNTQVIVGKKYYDRFGYAYNPAYQGMWCDNEFTDVGGLLARQAYIDWSVVHHVHPSTHGAEITDELYSRDSKFYHIDQPVYLRRKSEDFGGVQPRMLLSILMPTMVKRRDMRTALCGKIADQIRAIRMERSVEILIDEDSGQRTIGEKRTNLIQRARGEYIMFLDDDDDVSDKYMETILGALAAGDVDAVTFGGMMMSDPPKPFIHSLMYDHYFENDHMYFRPPNHWNAVRRSIAIKFPFINASFGEDADYSERMAKSGMIKTERFIPVPLYVYRPTPEGAASVFGQQIREQQARETAEKNEDGPPSHHRSSFRTEGVKAEREDPHDRKSSRRTRRHE